MELPRINCSRKPTSVLVERGYSRRSQIYSWALAFFALAPLSGCVSNPTITPVATTYPADKSKEVTNIINLPIPISLNLSVGLTGGSKNNPTNEKIGYSPGEPVIRTSFKQTIIGDAAEKELWIVPRNKAETSEARLLARLNEGGKKACGGAFLLKDTKYYYGTEGTLKLSGIKTPALSAVYRCPAKRVSVNDPDFRTVEKLSKKFRDHKYFDISSFLVPYPRERTVKSVRKAIDQRGLRMIMDKPRSATHSLIASGETRGIGGDVPEHLVLVAREEGGGTKVTMMQMRYQNTSHKRGVEVAGTGRPGFAREARPFARDVAYDYSRIFAEQILKFADKE